MVKWVRGWSGERTQIMEDDRKVVGEMKRNGDHGSIIASRSKIKGGKEMKE